MWKTLNSEYYFISLWILHTFPAMQHFLVLSPNICFVRESNSQQIQTQEQRHVPIRCCLYEIACKGLFSISHTSSPLNSGTSSNYLDLCDLWLVNPGTWEWGSVDGAWAPVLLRSPLPSWWQRRGPGSVPGPFPRAGAAVQAVSVTPWSFPSSQGSGLFPQHSPSLCLLPSCEKRVLLEGGSRGEKEPSFTFSIPAKLCWLGTNAAPTVGSFLGPHRLLPHHDIACPSIQASCFSKQQSTSWNTLLQKQSN